MMIFACIFQKPQKDTISHFKDDNNTHVQKTLRHTVKLADINIPLANLTYQHFPFTHCLVKFSVCRHASEVSRSIASV